MAAEMANHFQLWMNLASSSVIFRPSLSSIGSTGAVCWPCWSAISCSDIFLYITRVSDYFLARFTAMLVSEATMLTMLIQKEAVLKVLPLGRLSRIRLALGSTYTMSSCWR